MKRLKNFIIASILVIGMPDGALSGYRDMKQDLDTYIPPAMLRQSESTVSAGVDKLDPFETEKKAIEAIQDRWAATLQNRILPEKLSQLPTTAIDDDQALAMLQDRFSFQTINELILLRNPAIKAAAARAQAALEGFDQVTHLDSILRQYSAFTDGVMAGVGPMRGGDNSIGMNFPFPGVLALKGQVAEKNVEVEMHRLGSVQRDVVARGGKVYWNLHYTHRALRITSVMLDRLNHLESVATTRYGAGKTSYQDVAKIQIGREKLSEQLRTLKRQRTNLETELLSLIDLKPVPSLGRPLTSSPDTTVPKLDDLYPLAFKKRQELNRMRAMVAKLQRMIEMAETMIQPAFSQNYALYTDTPVLDAGSMAMKPSFDTRISPTRGLGLPKNAWFGTRDSYLRETRRKRDALEADLADAEASTRIMVRKGWFDLDRAIRERALFSNRLLELAETSLDVSTRGYESGKVSFADVIASYTDWLEVNLASERRLSDVGIAWIELERRIGTELRPKHEDR